MKKTLKEPNEHSTTRRELITHAVVATSAVAIATSLPSVLTHAQTGAPVELQKIGELVSKDKLLKGVIRITNGTKNIPGWTTRPMLRYFEGYDPRSNAAVWPTNKSGCYPGP